MRFKMRFIVSLIFLLSITALHATQPVLRIGSLSGDRYVGSYLHVFQDSSNNLTFEDILQSDSLFKQSTSDVPNLGVNNFNNWVKFQFVNDIPHDHLILNISNPSIDRVKLYKVVNGQIDSVEFDINGDLKERAVEHQFYTFDLFVPNKDTVTCYIKVNSVKQLLLPVSICAEKPIVSQILTYDLSSGFFIGIMLTVLLYNLFIFLGVRDNHYLAFVHYIFWVAVVQVAILGFFPRLIGSPILSNVKFVAFAGAMSGIASILFIKSFLNTKSLHRRVNWSLNTILLGDLIAIVLLIAGFPGLSYEIINFVAGLGSIVVLIIGFIALKNGNKSAKLFLIAWGIFLGSVIVYVLKDYGVLSYNKFTFHSVQIGVSIEALLLSFALADKINIYRKEKEESQAKAMQILMENEHLIRMQNIELERNVQERTKDLMTANDSLTATLQHLKDTQSQLVEAEKMASLGQLTAGVAHEINNPINFVTANVAPLRRDIDMIWEAIAEFEKLALNTELTTEEKLKWIADYKGDMDIDYVKTEVEFLLKGMHEGASRTAEIVKSLRVFSRVDEDTLKFADINEGVDSTMVILNSLVKDKIDVHKQYGDIPLIACYAGKLNQVFLNILSNAIYAIDKKFGESIGGHLAIETGIFETDSSIFIKITDNGIGIPEHVKDKIFEPFFTTKDVGEGTGLGMSIAYKTVEKHNGRILVESEVGVGTTFNIIIPMRHTE